MMIAAIFLAAVLQSTEPSETYLPVCISGEWGYINPAGEVVIPFQFDAARRFHDGRAAVKQGEHWQYINDSGKVVIATPFREARDFSEGYAAVLLPNMGEKNWFFIDHNGRPLVKNKRWPKVGDFSEGFAAVIDGTGVGYLNREGKLAMTFAFAGKLPSEFHDGMAAYSFPLIGSSSLVSQTYSRAIDIKGEMVFEKEGVLTRVPGCFVLQKAPNEDLFKVLGENGNEWHQDWVEGVAVPLESGPVAVLRDGEWQYQTPFGVVETTSQLQGAFAFSNGLAAARVGNTSTWQYLDLSGEWRIELPMRYAGDFDRGYAMVKFQDGICWIDRQGELIWAPQNYPVQSWEMELAQTRTGEDACQVLTALGDETETVALGQAVGVYRSFQEALAHARVRSGGEVVVSVGVDSDSYAVYAIDLSMFFTRLTSVEFPLHLVEDDLRAAVQFARLGDLEQALLEVNTSRIEDDMRLYRILLRDAPHLEGTLQVVAPKYHSMNGSNGGVNGGSKVELHGFGPKKEIELPESDQLPQPNPQQDGSWTYWSPKTFETAFTGTFDDARPFHEELASAAKDGLYGFIDLQGKWVIPPTYLNTSNFSEGLAMVVNSERQLGAIDRDGKLVIDFQPHALGDFHQGRARIIRDGKWGFIDRSGSEVIPAQYEWTGDFASGLAPIKMDGKHGYVDLSGNTVVEAQYKSATTHVEGMATAVTFDDQMHYLDETGAVVIEGNFLFASDFYDGVALVQRKSGRWRMIDREGEFHAGVETIGQ